LKLQNKSIFDNYSINKLPSIVIKDVTDDGREEFMFGNYAGGIQIFSIDSLTGVKDPPPAPSAIVTVNSIEKISVYPNPSQDFIQLTGLENNLDYSLYIFSIDGRLILVNEKFNSRETLDISHLNAGIYWLKIRHDKLGENAIKIHKQ
jgi:hypothetical protein